MLSLKAETRQEEVSRHLKGPRQAEPDPNPGLADRPLVPSPSCTGAGSGAAMGRGLRGAAGDPLAQPQQKSLWPCERFYRILLVPLYGDW